MTSFHMSVKEVFPLHVDMHLPAYLKTRDDATVLLALTFCHLSANLDLSGPPRQEGSWYETRAIVRHLHLA